MDSGRVPLSLEAQVAQHEIRIASVEADNQDRKKDMRLLNRELRNVFYVLILLLSAQIPALAAVIPELVKKMSGH